MKFKHFKKLYLATLVSVITAQASYAEVISQDLTISNLTEVEFEIELHGSTNDGSFSLRLSDSTFGSSELSNFFSSNSSFLANVNYNTDAPFRRVNDDSSFIANSLTVSVVDPVTNSISTAEAKLPTISEFNFSGNNELLINTFSAGATGVNLASTAKTVNVDFASLVPSTFSLRDGSAFSQLSEETLELANAFNFTTPSSYADLDLFASIFVSDDISLPGLQSEINKISVPNVTNFSSMILGDVGCFSNCGRIENGDEFIQFDLIGFSATGLYKDVDIGNTITDSPEPNQAESIFTNFQTTGALPTEEIAGVFELPDFAFSDPFITDSIQLGNGEVFELTSELTIGESFIFQETEVVESTSIVFDPIVAVAYDFQILNSYNDPQTFDFTENFFQSVSIPQLGTDNEFELYVYNEFGEKIFVSDILAGEVIELDDFVTHFEIAGIDADIGLDPNDPFAFPALLTFENSSFVDIALTPILLDNSPVIQEPTPVDVSAPHTLFMLSLSLFGLVRLSKKKKEF